jgi:SAM-dependent methyltransferase
MSGWQLIDNSAQAYERYLVPAIFTPFADELVEPVQRGARVLDVGCGTGIVARCAAARGAQVTGVDLNAQMLEVARAVAPAIEWFEADAAKLPVPDGSFDHVFCQQGLQFFADPKAAVRAMRRALDPGGQLVVSVWRPSPIYERFAGVLDAEAAAVMRSPFAGPDGDALRALLDGDAHIRIAIKTVRFPTPGEMLRQEIASSPMSVVVDDALDAAFAAATRPYSDDDGIVFPLETTVATASVRRHAK